MVTVYKDAGIIAARIGGELSEMDWAARKLMALAKAASLQHRDSGAFGESIRVRTVRGKRGASDRVVEVTDPLGAVKEFGHVIRDEKHGPELGYVPGQHSMLKAWTVIPRTGK